MLILRMFLRFPPVRKCAWLKRAVNRALRNEYGIGTCTVEEIGLHARAEASEKSRKLSTQCFNSDGIGRTARDRLCQVIPQHQLNPNLVTSFATDFCGVKTLRRPRGNRLRTS